MWISNARVVLPDQVIARGSVRLQAEWIVEIVEGPPFGASRDAIVDARGLTILPGLVDVHGDMLERDLEPRPGVYFPMDLALLELDKRLAAAGVTTAFPAISFLEGGSGATLRATDRARDLVELVHEYADSLLVDLRVHARFEITNPGATPTLLEILDQDKIELVSLMDHTPGQGQYRNLDTYAESIEKWRKISREEADRMAEARVKLAQEKRADWGVAEQIARAARRLGLTLASHDDDTREKVDRVLGLGVTLCEFPVTLEAAERARERGLGIVMGAPNVLLGGSHSGNLSARDALAAGLVDVLCADYYPAALLHAAYALDHAGILPFHHAVRLVSQNPATAVGLTDRGCVAVGYRADLLLVEEARRPRVRGTLRNGVPIYWDALLAERGPVAPFIPWESSRDPVRHRIETGGRR